jgi:uncharacterized membrane protein YkvA (DUF1232 family)
MSDDRPGTRFTASEIEAMRRAARDESGVLAEFWAKIRALSRKVPFAENIVMPFDAIPDFLPLVGFTDDAAVIAATLATVRAHLRDTHYEKARIFLGMRPPGT